MLAIQRAILLPVFAGLMFAADVPTVKAEARDDPIGDLIKKTRKKSPVKVKKTQPADEPQRAEPADPEPAAPAVKLSKSAPDIDDCCGRGYRFQQKPFGRASQGRTEIWASTAIFRSDEWDCQGNQW